MFLDSHNSIQATLNHWGLVGDMLQQTNLDTRGTVTNPPNCGTIERDSQTKCNMNSVQFSLGPCFDCREAG